MPIIIFTLKYLFVLQDIKIKILFQMLLIFLFIFLCRSWLCVIICDIAEKLENVNFLFYPELWNQFVKLSLKISLKMNDSTLMRTLKIISNKSLTQDESSNVNMIFQMTVSHSEFMNVMLSESDMKCT